jgi:hypothetical protein
MILTPDIERETERDVASDFLLRETPPGEYLGAKLDRGFDFSTTRMVKDAVKVGYAEDAAYGPADPRPEYNLHRPELWGPDGYDPLRPYRMDEATWKASEYYREGVLYTPKMTRARARILAEDFDRRRYRDSLIERSPSGLRSVLGFGAELLGNLPDPVNLLPLGLAGKGTTILARTGWAALEGAVSTGLADALVLPDLARRGEDVGWQDAANDILFGGLIGGVLGGAGKFLKDRRAARLEARKRTVMSDRATAGAALDKALDDFSTGRPVDVRPVLDTPEGQRLLREVQEIGRVYDDALWAPLSPSANTEAVLRSRIAEALDPSWAEIVVDKGSGRIERGRIRRELDYGLTKIIYEHGEASKTKPELQVSREDILDFPRVIREYEPAEVRVENGSAAWTWVVRGQDGGKVIHVAKLFTEGDGRPHLVTSHVANEGSPYPFSRELTTKEKAALLESLDRPREAVQDTARALNLSQQRESGSAASVEDIGRPAREVNWATERVERVDAPEPVRPRGESKAVAAGEERVPGLDPKTLEAPEARAVAEIEAKGGLLESEKEALRSAQDAFERSGRFEEAGLSIVECILAGGLA